MAYRGGFGLGFGYGLTPWVKRLIIANVAVFLVSELLIRNNLLQYYMAFVPGEILTRPWTLVTYMFAHGNLGHVFFNMLGLFFFGPPLEARWGSNEFLKFYFICGLGGAALSFLFAFNSPIIGASAAVYGVLLAFAMNWPDMPIYIWGIFPVQAKWLAIFFVALSLYSAFQGRADGLAHFAHLGGFAAGFLYMKLDRPGGLFAGMRKKGKDPRRRFTIVRGNSDDNPTPAPTPARRETAPPRDDSELLGELDRVLDKISTSGLSSLSSDERKLLDEVSRKYRQN